MKSKSFAFRQKVLIAITATAFLLLLSFLSGCKNAEPELETVKVRKLLSSGTWNLQTVVIDGVEKTTTFEGLKLTFTESHFTTMNGGVVWPASGVWTFADNTGKAIIRGDDIEITIAQISTSNLELHFSWSKTTIGAGRQASVSGDHEFVFIKP